MEENIATSMPALPAGLLLSARTELPAELAYLRDAYPQPGWAGHVNFGQLAAFWLQVHDSLREQGAKLGETMQAFREGRQDVASFQRSFVPRLNHFLQHLNGHHQIEDSAYFPRFRALDPRMVAGFDLLENDHELIHERLLDTVDSARGLLAALDKADDARRSAADAYARRSEELLKLLLQHLSDEEDLVIPAILEHGERRIS